MIEIGKNQFLKIIDEDQAGYYLTCKDKKVVFMPGSLVKKQVTIGDMIEVFIYLDNKGNDLATPNLPKAQVGELACLKVTSVTPHGAFLDLGIPKDILVPKSLQKYEMKVGEIHLVKVLIEQESMRLYGDSKIIANLKNNSISVNKKQSVNIIPYHRTTLGYKVLIEKEHLGIAYHNEIFVDVVFGKEYRGSVKKVRENGQIDVLLQEIGLKGVQTNSEKILAAIKSENGYLNLSDKSPPKEIENKLKMSKSSFKKAVGILYKNKRITLEKGYIKSISKANL